MRRSRSKDSKCLFCARNLPRLSRSHCKDEHFTLPKKMRLETNPDTHHQALHEALSSKDCGTVSHLLENGEKLCSTDGIENCITLITKFYNIECLEKVLSSQPSAIHCRGPQGQTLLMYSRHFHIMETLFKFKPDINACNDSGRNVLMHLTKENIENYCPSNATILKMAHFLVDKGINVTTTDALGKTAIEYVMEYVIGSPRTSHSSKSLRNHIDLIKKLAEAGATMNSTDSLGRTLAMNYVGADIVVPDCSFMFILDLLRQGEVDPKARDNDGNNLMDHLFASYFKCIASARNKKKFFLKRFADLVEEDYDEPSRNFMNRFRDPWAFHSEEISRRCLDLVRCGCELGGLDEICERNRPFSFTIGGYYIISKVAKSVNILSLLLLFQPPSYFISELLQYNLALKKSSKCISELTFYFLNYDWWGMEDGTFEMVDATVTHLLASGVNVMQHTPGGEYLVDRGSIEIENEIGLTLPDSFWLAGQLMLRVADEMQAGSDVKKPYYISCKILVSLLRFWNYPPLMLVLFICVEHLHSICCARALLKFLTRVGGRLPPGSPLFKCLKKDLEKHANRDRAVIELSHLFSKLHEEIPSLKELCRTAVRATLSKITTSGLDLSSLPQVLCQGEWREIPGDVLDYLNFKDQPLFCEEDLAE